MTMTAVDITPRQGRNGRMSARDRRLNEAARDPQVFYDTLADQIITGQGDNAALYIPDWLSVEAVNAVRTQLRETYATSDLANNLKVELLGKKRPKKDPARELALLRAKGAVLEVMREMLVIARDRDEAQRAQNDSIRARRAANRRLIEGLTAAEAATDALDSLGDLAKTVAEVRDMRATIKDESALLAETTGNDAAMAYAAPGYTKIIGKLAIIGQQAADVAQSLAGMTGLDRSITAAAEDLQSHTNAASFAKRTKERLDTSLTSMAGRLLGVLNAHGQTYYDEAIAPHLQNGKRKAKTPAKDKGRKPPREDKRRIVKRFVRDAAAVETALFDAAPADALELARNQDLFGAATGPLALTTVVDNTGLFNGDEPGKGTQTEIVGGRGLGRMFVISGIIGGLIGLSAFAWQVRGTIAHESGKLWDAGLEQVDRHFNTNLSAAPCVLPAGQVATYAPADAYDITPPRIVTCNTGRGFDETAYINIADVPQNAMLRVAFTEGDYNRQSIMVSRSDYLTEGRTLLAMRELNPDGQGYEPALNEPADAPYLTAMMAAPPNPFEPQVSEPNDSYAVAGILREDLRRPLTRQVLGLNDEPAEEAPTEPATTRAATVDESATLIARADEETVALTNLPIDPAALDSAAPEQSLDSYVLEVMGDEGMPAFEPDSLTGLQFPQREDVLANVGKNNAVGVLLDDAYFANRDMATSPSFK